MHWMDFVIGFASGYLASIAVLLFVFWIVSDERQ